MAGWGGIVTRRSWTGQDQIFAEVAAACGTTIADIGQILGFSETAPRNNLLMGRKEKNKAYAVKHGKIWRKANRERLLEQKRQYYKVNREHCNSKSKQWYEANCEKTKEYKRQWYRANWQRIKEKDRQRYHEYRKANKEKLLERSRKYYEANREQILERARMRHKLNPSKQRERHRKYYEANKENLRKKACLYRKNNQEKLQHYYKANQKKIQDRAINWARANPEKRRAIAFQGTQIRRARKLNAIDPNRPVTPAIIARRRLLFGNACVYCGSRKSPHIDHVEALARKGLHVPENLAPACVRCNCSKNDRPVEAWYKSQPFFCQRRWEILQKHTGAQQSGIEQLSLLDAFQLNTFNEKAA